VNVPLHHADLLGGEREAAAQEDGCGNGNRRP